MKKIIFMTVCLISFVMFTSCGSSTPSDKALEYVGYMKDAKYKELVDEIVFPAESTPEEIEQSKNALISMLTEKGSKQLEEKGGIVSYKVTEETIAEDGKTAQVKVDIKYGDGEVVPATYDLIWVDGEWKLDAKK